MTTSILKNKTDLLSKKVDVEERFFSEHFQVFNIREEYPLGFHEISIRGSRKLKSGTLIFIDIIDEKGQVLRLTSKQLEDEQLNLPARRISFEIDDNVVSGVATVIVVGTSSDGRIVRYTHKFLINKELPRDPLVERGEWEADTKYFINDVVQFEGNSYIRILTGISLATFELDISSSPSPWRPFVEFPISTDKVTTGTKFLSDVIGEESEEVFIKKEVKVEEDGEDGTLSKRMRQLDDEGIIKSVNEFGSFLELNDSHLSYQMAFGGLVERMFFGQNPFRADDDENFPTDAGIGYLLKNLLRTVRIYFYGFTEPDVNPKFIFEEFGGKRFILSRDNIYTEFNMTQPWNTIEPPFITKQIAYNVGTGVNFRISTEGITQEGKTITGIVGGVNGREIRLRNIGAESIRFNVNDSDSISNNQIDAPSNIDLPQGQTLILIHNGSKWEPQYFYTP